MKPNEAIDMVCDRARSPVARRRPILLRGSPATGKSAVPFAAAKILNNARVYVYEAARLDPVDAGGLPYPVGDRLTYLRPVIMPELSSDEHVILFFDELDKATPAVLNALMNVIHTRQSHGHRLGDNVTIIAAANLLSDRVNGTRLPATVLSRMQVVSLEPDLAQWCEWAATVGIHPMVPAFLQFREHKNQSVFYAFDPLADAFPSPRTWHAVSDTLHESADCMARYDATEGRDVPFPRAGIERELIEGTIGRSVAIEFLGFMRVADRMPRLASILRDPEGIDVPTDPSVLFACAGMLARNATDENFATVLRYAERMAPEIAAFLVTSAVAANGALASTPAFIAWGSKHSDILI
jgi:hypothetical protein